MTQKWTKSLITTKIAFSFTSLLALLEKENGIY